MSRSLLEIVPPGCIMYFSDNTIPSNWLLCNGQLYSKSTYSELYSAIGDTFGANRSSFRVPDLRNEFIRGVSGNRDIGSKQGSSLKAHNHTATTNGAGEHKHNFQNMPQGQIFMKDRQINTRDDILEDVELIFGEVFLEANVHDHEISISLAGDGNETRPRNVALHAVIKF